VQNFVIIIAIVVGLLAFWRLSKTAACSP